jgi:hypothetical protein
MTDKPVKIPSRAPAREARPDQLTQLQVADVLWIG